MRAMQGKRRILLVLLSVLILMLGILLDRTLLLSSEDKFQQETAALLKKYLDAGEFGEDYREGHMYFINGKSGVSACYWALKYGRAMSIEAYYALNHPSNATSETIEVVLPNRQKFYFYPSVIIFHENNAAVLLSDKSGNAVYEHIQKMKQGN